MKFKRSVLLTSNENEIDCLIISRKPLIYGGEEVIAYAQNRLFKGFVQDDDDFVVEIDIIIEFCIIPELQEMLYELQSNIKL